MITKVEESYHADYRPVGTKNFMYWWGGFETPEKMKTMIESGSNPGADFKIYKAIVTTERFEVEEFSK